MVKSRFGTWSSAAALALLAGMAAPTAASDDGAGPATPANGGTPAGGADEGGTPPAIDVAGEVVHDNGRPDGSNAYPNTILACIGARRSILDDFEVPAGETWRLRGMRHPHVVRKTGVPGTIAELVLWTDDAGAPDAPWQELLVDDMTETPTGRQFFERHEVIAWVTFEPVELGPGRYWIESVIGGGAVCPNHWLVTDERFGSECWVNYDDFGGLSPGSAVFGGIEADMAWTLVGERVGAAPAEDVDRDGTVGVLDLRAVVAAWGSCAACPEDLDGDGHVGVDDLLAVLRAWRAFAGPP